MYEVRIEFLTGLLVFSLDLLILLNYLISGLPGTGKTAVCIELRARGYNAIDADRDFGHQSGADWLWDETKVESVINNISNKVVFICDGASNRDRYISRFSKVFILHVDDQTLRHRLLSRTNNNFGKDLSILARQIERNQGVKEYATKRGRVVIDATHPVSEVADDILARLN